MVVEKIVVGRDREDLRKFGARGTAFIGKHIVGSGEQAHLTNPIQIDVVRPHVILICGKRGTGKCVEENTLLTLTDGRQVMIKDLEKKQTAIMGLDGRLKVSKLERTEFYRRQVAKLLLIKTRSGRRIKMTHEHPLLTIRGWVPVRELRIGSRIACPRKIEAFGNLPIEPHKIKLLAYLIAEGHMSRSFVLFSNTDEKILNEFFGSVGSFDGSLRISPHSKPGCYRVTQYDKDYFERDGKGRISKPKTSIKRWIDELGLNKLSGEKFVPEQILCSSKENISLFLNRLFSCDGSIYEAHPAQWEVSYSSKSEVLARQIAHLLLRFGILSKLRQKNNKLGGKVFESFEVVVGSDNVERFVDEIGFFGRKEEVAKRCQAATAAMKRNPNTDTIPKEIWDMYRPESWAMIGRKLGYAVAKAARSSVNYSPSRDKLLKMAMADGNIWLKRLAESDIFWDEITMIEELEGDFTVCDISVPDAHNFLANDIIVHNSYTGAVIAEEIALLPKEVKQNLSVLMIDTMGIYWSMKNPNDRDASLLKEWDMAPKAMAVKLFVPKGYIGEYKEAGVRVDAPFTLPCGEITSMDWILTFGFSLLDPHGIAIDRAVKTARERFDAAYAIDEIIAAVEADPRTEKAVKDAVVNRFLTAKDWGIFEKQGTSIYAMLAPGAVSVIDVSHYMRVSAGWSVRSMVVGLLARRIFQERLMARKTEEFEAMTGEKRKSIPMVWLIMDEAHQFLPSQGETAASEPLHTLIKEGREPGISLALITQRPNKLHEDALAQSDLIISHRLTSRSDIEALRSIMQTYVLDDVQQLINSLPRSKGAAIVLDDNSERLYAIQVRPRLSWHAGGSPVAIKETGILG
ncbi:MAG: hypothetical protein HY519_01110 [Candidatus Aenigmarchaeota archaeon]|nr:hypothetical protein [Candidatus Aenigmarchaeota archaeon]